MAIPKRRKNEKLKTWLRKWEIDDLPQLDNYAVCPFDSDGNCDPKAFTGELANDTIEVFLTSDVTQADSMDIVALMRDNPTLPVRFEINSPGGSFDGALGMFHAMTDHEAEVVVDITGAAHSAAFLASQGADVIRMRESASIVLHEARAIPGVVTRATAEFLVDYITQGNERLIAMVAARSCQPTSTIEELVTARGGEGTPLNAKRAKELGFVDEIVPTPARNPQRQNAIAVAAVEFTARHTRNLSLTS